MKILEITAEYRPLNITGAEKFCVDLTDKLTKSHTVLIASSTRYTQTGRHQNIPLVKVRNKFLRKIFFDYYNPINANRIRVALKNNPPDIIHIHNLYGIGYNILRICARSRPTVVTVHDYWPFDYDSNLLRGKYTLIKTLFYPIHRLILRRNLVGVTLVAPSNFMATKLKENLGENPLSVIRNGINLTNTSSRLENVILFVGRFTYDKGIHTILESVREILVQHQDWRFILLGEGSLRPRYQKEYPEFLFKGFVNPEPYYSKASITIVPSIWPENLPYVIAESINYGIPVLASRKGGIPEMVVHGKTGILYGNQNEMKEGLSRLISDRDYLKKLHRGALRQKQNLDFNSTVRKYIELFQSKLQTPLLK
jgi:glycosyltransferase involved in cell wall biosynthesis